MDFSDQAQSAATEWIEIERMTTCDKQQFDWLDEFYYGILQHNLFVESGHQKQSFLCCYQRRKMGGGILFTKKDSVVEATVYLRYKMDR